MSYHAKVYSSGLVVLCLTVLFGCDAIVSGGSWLTDRFTVRAMRAYTEELARSAQVELDIVDCEVIEGQRSGYCVVQLSPQAEEIFDRRYQLAPIEGRIKQTDKVCLPLEYFSPRGGAKPGPGVALELLPGVQQLKPHAPLPANEDNVVFYYLWRRPGQPACIHYEFPYG